MTIAGTGARGEHGCSRQAYRGSEIDGPIKRIRNRTTQACKDQGNKAGAVGLMLAYFEDTHHQRNHNQSAAQTDEAAEYAGRKSDSKAN